MTTAADGPSGRAPAPAKAEFQDAVGSISAGPARSGDAAEFGEGHHPPSELSRGGGNPAGSAVWAPLEYPTLCAFLSALS